jgi:hypothetical protein
VIPLPAADPVDYLRDVKPILTARCVACHGPLKQRSGLRLDTAALLRKGGKRGPGIVPGQSEVSPLLERVTATEETERMPPEGTPLTAAQIAVLRTWIDQGGKALSNEVVEDPRHHWSLKPPIRSPTPGVRNKAWARNPLDAFLAAQHEARGVVPRPEAAPAVLLRRVYLELVGLPPTKEELHAFLADSSPLEETLVLWGSEFGRSPGLQASTGDGRDHHPFAFSTWLAGGGIKGGVVHGASDELGFHAVESRHYVTDLHATVLHQLGLDSRQLEIPGRKRLEIEHGQPIREIMTRRTCR